MLTESNLKEWLKEFFKDDTGAVKEKNLDDFALSIIRIRETGSPITTALADNPKAAEIFDKLVEKLGQSTVLEGHKKEKKDYTFWDNLKEFLYNIFGYDLEISGINGREQFGGNAPIHYLYKDPKVIKSLVDLGADVNLLSQDGNTALTLAATGACSESFKQLLKEGANINHKDSKGNNIFHVIVENYKGRDALSYDIILGSVLGNKDRAVSLMEQNNDIPPLTPLKMLDKRIENASQQDKVVLSKLKTLMINNLTQTEKLELQQQNSQENPQLNL